MTPQPRPLPPARPLEVRPGAGGAVRSAGLPSAAGAWRHSLRFRLALTYSALALLMIMLVSAGVVALLLSRMDQQFNARLNERADTLAEAFTGTGQVLGKTSGGPTSYTMLVKDGTVIYASPILREFDRSPFPFGEQSRVNIQDTTVRAVKRQAGDFGTLWVGLPEDDLIAARE